MSAVGLSVVAVAVVAPAAQEPVQRPDALVLGEVVQEIESLDALRSSLASSFSGDPDRSTFAQVCGPVGAQARRLVEEKGWRIQQLAEKYRNPGHKLDEEAELVYRLMAEDPGLMGMWARTEMEEGPGIRYFRRIVVEQACLACHGPKDSRPQFVRAGYPDDRAFDFEVGDLRGLYSVFVADSP
ncbi:MAG: DUF3365 domain-containing protein [Gemmatimonadota bacterium]|nr:MAG: DUF3365 domain-containing protein [Gemmatimonadota bacterium]